MSRTYFWNDETMSFTWKGIDIVAGGEIPVDYKKEQPEKFAKFLKTQQISEKKKVEFAEKKQNELTISRAAVEKLKARIGVLLKEKIVLQVKADKYEIGIEGLENIESINDELSECKAEIKDLSEYKLDAQKKISEYGSFIIQVMPILKQDSISKDDKSALLGIIGGLEIEVAE